MNWNFNEIVVLTSKHPESFLVFNSTSGQDRWIVPTCVSCNEIFYINGIKATDYTISDKYALYVNDDFKEAVFHIYTESNKTFDAGIQFHVYDDAGLSSFINSVDVSIYNRPFIVSSFSGKSSKYSNDDLLNDNEASYLLMRTNPKLTGNIAIYVDKKDNVYLDTIKVSDTLSNKKYRHQQISTNSVLSSDIRRIYSSLPLGELYKIDAEDTFNVSIPTTDYKNQFNRVYSYGARLIMDDLYPEDNGLFAPLWINSTLPDYFAVFRVKGTHNEETYNNTPLENLGENFLKEGNLLCSWSLKKESPLGDYLHTHLDHILEYQSSVFLSLTDPVLVDSESDPNTWNGIAIDKGIVAGRSETPYFFNQISNNLTELNAFVTDGFERNNLVCPNLLNLQFLFDDNEVDDFTMHRYYGLYLTENVLYKIAYYSDSSTGPIEIISLDGKNSNDFFESNIFNNNGDIINDYKNRLFILNDNKQLKRFSNVHEIDNTQRNEYVSKPDKHLFNTHAVKTNINPFVTIALNKTLNQGEHLRIINKTQYKIWEIYGVDTEQFSCEKYCTTTEPEPGYPQVYRTFFSINGDIKYQATEICAAIDRFADYEENVQFRCGLHGSNWVSIIINDGANIDDEWVFQRIAAPTLNDYDDDDSGFNTAAEPEDLMYFGRLIFDEFDVIEYDASYGPIDFELYGDRQYNEVTFVNRGSNNLYSLEVQEDMLDKFEKPTLYQGTDLWYRRLLNFGINNNGYLYVQDPLSLDNKILIMTETEVQLINNKINTYSIYPLNISLMGINPVKDIDYTVYDTSLGSKSEFNYIREDDLDTYKKIIIEGDTYVLSIVEVFEVISGTGSYIQDGITTSYGPGDKFNTFNGSVTITAATTTTITYSTIPDGQHTYKGYKSGSIGNEENINDYYYNKESLRYGLTIPTVVKWAGVGTDCRNNPLRLILNDNILDVSTNFIPDTETDSFVQEISYPVFKYLSPGEREWKDYIFYDINDVVEDDNSFITIKELMFKYPYVDYFSKLIYSNYEIDKVFDRTSTVFYNLYKDAIDVILLGLRYSFKINNVAKNIVNIRNYDRYRFSFISTASRNKSGNRPIEIIINENTETILMIWYQGNDELNYNIRYSTYLPEKSILDTNNLGYNNESFVKSSILVRTDMISTEVDTFYGTMKKVTDEEINPYLQYNKGVVNSVFAAMANIGDIDTNKITILPIEYFEIANINNELYSFTTFDQEVKYGYQENSNTFGDYVVNYGYNYGTNKNFYIDNTCNLNTLKYLLESQEKYVMYHFIRGEQTFNSLSFGGNINPINISIETPRSYRNLKTYHGWQKPIFNNIFEFKPNESDDFINTVERDFIFSNTNFREYKNIPQYWYNKLKDNVTELDVSVGCAIDYMNEYNVFLSLWDANYFVKYDYNNNNETKEYINGYVSPDEIPSFFGSKLPKLPDFIKLTDWDITTAESEIDDNHIILSFNLTRATLNLFKENNTFLSNWSSFVDTDTAIDGYIRNTVIPYYNFRQSEIKLDFYYKSRDTELLHYGFDNEFKQSVKENFDGQLEYVNDEYIYRMEIPITGNFSYYVSFAINEK